MIGTLKTRYSWWLASALLALIVAGCQSGPHTHPPPRTLAPPTPPRVAIVAPVHKAIAAGAWKAEANRWLGVKYRKGGIDRTGIDCSGLSSRMYLAVAGVALPRTSQDQSLCGKLVAPKDLRSGDLIFFITLSEKTIDHVGIYLGDNQFVHASPSRGVVVSSLLQDYYRKRYHSARRIVL